MGRSGRKGGTKRNKIENKCRTVVQRNRGLGYCATMVSTVKNTKSFTLPFFLTQVIVVACTIRSNTSETIGSKLRRGNDMGGED